MNNIQNNHYQETENRFKCDMAHYLRSRIDRCIHISKYKRIIMAAAAISAIIHITIGIASPHGVLIFENNLIIKYSEVGFSIFVVWFFLKDIVFEIKKVGEDA